MKDLFGKAILDYYTNNSPEDILTETSISEEDTMPVSYLFREFDEMPALEQKALQMAYGKVLDVGCGAGSHSLELQKREDIVMHSIDISENAIATCQKRGIQNAEVKDILAIESEKYDTILLLMNGSGIFRMIQETPKYLQKLKELLEPNGQILIDSSDIIYMFDEEEDGGKWVSGDAYYGELTFSISYKKEKEEFPWLYLDFNTLKNLANENDLDCELITNGKHYDYLAKLSHQKPKAN